NILESYHDAQQSLDNAMTLFSQGYLPLDQRSLVENLYWAICHKIQKLAQQLEFVPEELQGLDSLLSDTYFCNFSLFQSIPDAWVRQLRDATEVAVREGRICYEEAGRFLKFYEEGLHGYTYLEEPEERQPLVLARPELQAVS